MPMLTCKDFKELHRMVDEIYAEADRLDIRNSELASKAGLCYATVCRLASYATMYPRTQTVMMLAKAVGLRVRLEKREAGSGFRLVG